jgi:hypothetical protein
MRRTIARAAAAPHAVAPRVAAIGSALVVVVVALAVPVRAAEPDLGAAAPVRHAGGAGEAWRAAWQQVAGDRAFREAGCFSSLRELAALDGDRIRHRPLARDDFRARRRSRDAKFTVTMKNAVTEAHVATSLVCIGRLRAEELAPGRFAVWFEDLEYVALLDREGSWWNPRSETHPEWVLRHEQLHFDITELVARRHNRDRARDAARTRAVAASPGEAMRRFAERWSAHFAALRADWEALQERYDRETRHGTAPAVQTQWFARVHRELAALPAPPTAR